MPSHANFEIDIISALSSQLVAAFSKLEIGKLTEEALDSLPKGHGVYKLYHGGSLVYVGQAEKLRKRLGEHQFKIRGRQKIDVADMGFKCLFIHKNWTALAPENSLIKYYREAGEGECAWNGNGFGPHDPGKERETTNKAPDGFDAQFPIRKDWVCEWIRPGEYSGAELLSSLKRGLPYLLRYEMQSKNSRLPHEEYKDLKITVPPDCRTAEEILRVIAQSVMGWQATAFPGHLIFYKEKRDYRHGTVIWPV